jgi:hypothetical protein
MVTATTAWVEHGAAPDMIMAVQYSSDGQQQFGATPPGGPNNNGTQSATSGNKSLGQILPTGGNPISASGKVIRTLPAYPYPMVPKFTGKGDVNDGSNYMPVRSTTMSQDDLRWLGQDLFTPSS